MLTWLKVIISGTSNNQLVKMYEIEKLNDDKYIKHGYCVFKPHSV